MATIALGGYLSILLTVDTAAVDTAALRESSVRYWRVACASLQLYGKVVCAYACLSTHCTLPYLVMHIPCVRYGKVACATLYCVDFPDRSFFSAEFPD